MEKDKKLEVRNKIINAAQIYKNELAGKYFLYIFSEKFVEIFFKTSNFSHLTGVVTKLNGEEFYKKAKKRQLNEGQFGFNKEHPFDLAKKKTDKLDRLPELTNKDVFIIEGMASGSKFYKIGVTNLDFTLGLIENRDEKTKKLIDGFLIPTTFRVRGKSDLKNNLKNYPIDFTLMKDRLYKKYDTICFKNDKYMHLLPQNILKLIDDKLIDNDKNKAALKNIEPKQIITVEEKFKIKKE